MHRPAFTRRGSAAGCTLELLWDDVDTHWRSLIIRDKVEDERTIPLTPYVQSLLAALPRRRGNPWVFSSPMVNGGACPRRPTFIGAPAHQPGWT